MFRTTIIDLPTEQKWVLQGRLCRRWAADLKEKWESTRTPRPGQTFVVDLEDVSSVDEEGEKTLLELLGGAVLVVQRAYMKSVVESLKART
jgi:ABC-type transporter Mla MlaB component